MGEQCIFNSNNEHSRLIFTKNECKTYSFQRLNNTICYLKLILNETFNTYTFIVNNNSIIVGNSIKAIPIFEDEIKVEIESETKTNLVLDVYQENCPVCAEVSSSHFTLIELPRNNCLIRINNSRRICSLQLDINKLKGEGYIGVGTERLWGNISGVRNITFSGEHLVLRNVTANIKGRLQECSLTEMNLLQLPVMSPVKPSEDSIDCPGRIYEENTFTIISPGFPRPFAAHTCIYEVRKWRPEVCRLKLTFHFFWLGRGYNGVCHDGFLEIDGYRFCGCQTGLNWSTSVNTFRNGRAFLLFTSKGRSEHFSLYLLTVEQQTCDYQGRYLPKAYSDHSQFNMLARFPEICNAPVVTLTDHEGIIASPQYPRSCPGHFIFRFELHPGKCGVEIAFDDFDLSNSWQCSQDFITLEDSGRYCGEDLLQKTVRLLRGEMWVSLVGGRGRGFLARFRQVDCGDGRPDGNNGSSRDRDYTQESQGQCEHIYTIPRFKIQGPYTTSCTFIVRKSHPDICKLRIKLKDVELNCGLQNLNINGQYYCGRILGDEFDLQFVNDFVEFKFNTKENKYPALFTIEGEQLNCVLLEEQIGGECVISLRSPRGKVQSPGLYPRPPENLKCSYQFLPLKGICSIQLDFDDVNLPTSDRCTDAYLNINGQNYCGKTLSRTSKTLKTMLGRPVEIPYMVNKYLTQFHWNFTYTQVLC
uniref:CUB domain-containing protein n=1 Tax=Rhodnius prolixus TaxID=13249 RepID=T1H8R5_RHOPR